MVGGVDRRARRARARRPLTLDPHAPGRAEAPRPQARASAPAEAAAAVRRGRPRRAALLKQHGVAGRRAAPRGGPGRIAAALSRPWRRAPLRTSGRTHEAIGDRWTAAGAVTASTGRGLGAPLRGAAVMRPRGSAAAGVATLALDVGASDLAGADSRPLRPSRRSTDRGSRRASALSATAAASGQRQKIILPAVVCSTLVTRDLDRPAQRLLALVHHHHRPVVEVGDALARLLAFLEDEDAQHLARAARPASGSSRAR